MPNGLCEKGTQEAAAVYYEHILLYPYQMYIHWSPSDQGNILFNDKRFVSLLYRWHNDEFTEYNKVSDAGSYIKDSIYDFIDDSRKVVIVVDCENSDPYKLSATLRRLNSTYTEKITSIILFDDIHTASAWSSLEKFTSCLLYTSSPFYYLTPRGLSQHLLETARKRSARGLICVTPHLGAIS